MQFDARGPSGTWAAHGMAILGTVLFMRSPVMVASREGTLSSSRSLYASEPG